MWGRAGSQQSAPDRGIGEGGEREEERVSLQLSVLGAEEMRCATAGGGGATKKRRSGGGQEWRCGHSGGEARRLEGGAGQTGGVGHP